MGAANVIAAYTRWGQLPDPAFRLLVYMAVVSKDADQPPRFWAGRDVVAMFGLGRSAPLQPADYRAARRAITQLLEAGAIERERHSAPGQTARYVLALAPTTGVASRPPNRGRVATSEQGSPGDHDRGRPVTEQGSPGDRTGVVARPHEEQQEPGGASRGTSGHPSRVPHGGARARRCDNGMIIAGDGTCCADHAAAAS